MIFINLVCVFIGPVLKAVPDAQKLRGCSFNAAFPGLPSCMLSLGPLTSQSSSNSLAQTHLALCFELGILVQKDSVVQTPGLDFCPDASEVHTA